MKTSDRRITNTADIQQACPPAVLGSSQESTPDSIDRLEAHPLTVMSLIADPPLELHYLI